ncbi:hypothetical protein ACFP2T_15340 [Plantactinospora solaniradicis]|uniref:DUF222 domain-containing protein n=1 Tax=Plantactinospora solaniradicis TaxID=1723736 RepID=A0ABW1K7L8_9ACTN
MSATLTARSALSLLRQHFRNLGLDLPAEMTAALDELSAASDHVTLHANPRALGAAILDALTDGTDPATDPAVLAELARRQLTGLSVLIADAIEERRAAILHTYAADILNALTPVVAAADTALTDAREKIGDRFDLADTTIEQLRPTEMTLWGTAREHAHRAQLAAQCWQTVVLATGLVDLPTYKHPLILADLDADQLDALGNRPAANTPIAAGHRLDLATPDTFRQRCQRIDKERTERAAKREREQRGGLRAVA